MTTVEAPKHRATQAARINPDSRAVLFLVVGITTALALVSFVVSFAGLMAVAQWAALPPYLWWALPVFIDGAIIVYTMSMLVFRQRGESTFFAWSALIGFTAVSVFANGAHAYAEGDPAQWQTWIGTGLAGLAPAAVALAIHTVAMLLVVPHSPDPAPMPVIIPDVIEVGTIADVGEPDDGDVAVANLPQPTPAVNETENPAPDIADNAAQGAGEEPSPSDKGAVVATWPQPAKAPAASAEKVEAVALYEQGLSQKEIGERFGVSKSTISRWVREAKTQSEAAQDNSHLRVVGN